MQPRKTCWPHTVALCISAREPQKFSNEFHIHVFGTVREVQGRAPGRRRSVARTPASYSASSASRAVSVGSRCEAGRAADAGPVRASPPRLGEDSSGSGHRPELRRIPARRRCLNAPGRVRGQRRPGPSARGPRGWLPVFTAPAGAARMRCCLPQLLARRAVASE